MYLLFRLFSAFINTFYHYKDSANVKPYRIYIATILLTNHSTKNLLLQKQQALQICSHTPGENAEILIVFPNILYYSMLPYIRDIYCITLYIEFLSLSSLMLHS